MRARVWPILLVFAAAVPVAAQDLGLGRRDVGPIDPALLPQVWEPFPGTPGATPDGTGTGAPGEPPPVGEFGEQEILVRLPTWEPWAVGASFGVDHQSNAPLSPVDPEGDEVWTSAVSLRGTVPLTDLLYADFGGQHQSVRYAEFDFLDFDRIDADAGLLWVLPSTWHRAIAGAAVTLKANYYRLSDAWHYGVELFSDVGVGVGILKSIAIDRNNTLLWSLNADVSIDASDVLPQRDEYSALVAWRSLLAPEWELNLFGRAAFYDYNTHDDGNFIAAASIDWVPQPWLWIGVAANFTYNVSDVRVFEYENWTVGPRVRASFRF